eukprot:TRINITY_DN5152_c0_g1::TRINITY_DN5152_c0_g1_i1::g.29405::m.29405 TRINITY_DN5152_c0_g1::TRINITY_DN5152_c0_g1_i1::g.29405  ORF type:complete len:219 (+),score=42.25,sp/Q8R1V4/TMED4_MOUSE/27.16/6e-29,EMP24_GP25L/PF01105.19/4.4e-36,DUF137/PF02006.11/0.051,DUF3244/PF11589.3/0.12,DUF3244/PF11589.3/2.3e+03,Fe-S_assembly/PF04384.8/0.17,Filamin/PF00630.14/0.11 TRINITY_DN5152_c0_g1_i1:39-659(+)
MLQKSMTLLLFLCLCLFINSAQAAYFTVDSSRSRCFFEDVIEHTIVFGKYRSPDSTNPDVQIDIRVTDPSGEVFIQKKALEKGKVAFTSMKDGAYKICFSTNSPGEHPFHVEFQQGFDEDNKVENPAKASDVTIVENKFRQMMMIVDNIQNNQKRHRRIAQDLLTVHNNTDNKAFWFTALQLIVIVASGFWQLRHLTVFFESKKVV